MIFSDCTWVVYFTWIILRVVSGEWKKLRAEQVKQNFRKVCPEELHHHLQAEQAQSDIMSLGALTVTCFCFVQHSLSAVCCPLIGGHKVYYTVF
jgi:hypothetical protein